jgi:hypothetical protein
VFKSGLPFKIENRHEVTREFRRGEREYKTQKKHRVRKSIERRSEVLDYS